MDPVIEAIVKEIINLPLKEALALLAAKKILDFSGKGYGEIKRVIQDKQNECKYAFVPNKEEAKNLLGYDSDPQYIAIEIIVPDYRHIDLLRTGLLINSYQKNPTRANTKRVSEIKKQIRNRPNGGHFLKIVNLPTTPLFSSIVDYLYQRKKEGYTNVALKDELNEIIETFDKMSLFVKTGSDKDIVIDFCKKHVKIKDEAFFILGMGLAGDVVLEAIQDLTKKKFFEKNQYKINIISSPDEEELKKVEITVYLDDS